LAPPTPGTGWNKKEGSPCERWLGAHSCNGAADHSHFVPTVYIQEPQTPCCRSLFELGRREAIVTAIHPSVSLSARPFLLRPGEQRVHCHFSRFFFLLLQAGGFYSRTSQSPQSSFPPALCSGRRYFEGAAPHRRERSGTARSWQPSLSSPKVEVSLSPPGGLGLIHALRRTKFSEVRLKLAHYYCGTASSSSSITSFRVSSIS
jgi:hypothetical protein